MTTTDILQIEGINSKGFGRIAKILTHDLALTIESKAIYAYLASYAGCGSVAFPSRDKIINDLNISKTRYYKHFNLLIEQEYIKINKKGTKNIYVLTSSPKCLQQFDDDCDVQDDDELISSSSLLAQGYGTIPKLLMQDERLSITAKGIYSFFASYAGCGNSVFPSRAKILYYLRLTKNTYYTHLQQLISLNYITVKQKHSKKNGRLINNLYILEEMPNILFNVTPCPKNEDILQSTENATFSPCPKNEDILKSTENTHFSPCPKNEDILSNSPCPKNEDITVSQKRGHIYNNTNINNTNIITNQSIYHEDNIYTISEPSLDGLNDLSQEEILQEIKDNGNALPYYYHSDRANMKAALTGLTNIEELKQSSLPEEQAAYNIIFDCLFDLATITDKLEINKKYVSYVDAITKINDNIIIDEWGEPSLYDFMLSFFGEYCRIIRTYKIKNISNYMLSCVYNWLCVGIAAEDNAVQMLVID